MTDLRDGFLYHPDGGSPTDQLKRLLAGEHNLVLDDLFGTTLHEADDAIRKAEKDHATAIDQLRRLEIKIKELKGQKAEIATAIHRFGETGEISEVLYPACDKLLASQRQDFSSTDAKIKAKEIDAAETAICDALGEGWDVSDTHADDEYVYVTVKRRRAMPPPTPRPTRDSLIEKVKQAFETHRLAFRDRVKPARLASIVVMPRAP